MVAPLVLILLFAILLAVLSRGSSAGVEAQLEAKPEADVEADIEGEHVCSSPTECGTVEDPLLPIVESCQRDPGTGGDVETEDPSRPTRRCPCTDQAYVWAFENSTVLVTDPVARLLAGPLTLLAAFRRKRWEDRIKHVQKRGELRVHVLGAHARLEPYMLWEEVLVGRRSSFSKMVREVLATLGLRSPFEELGLELTINGFDHDFEDACLEVVNGRSGIDCSQGRYVSKIQRKPRTPDFAIMLNAGLASEPGHWKDTLVHLLRKKIPFAVTNYNSGWMKRATNPTLPAVDYSTLHDGVSLSWVGHRFRPSQKLLSCRRRRLGDLTTLDLLDGRIVDGHPNPFFYADEANAIDFGNAELLVVQGRKTPKTRSTQSALGDADQQEESKDSRETDGKASKDSSNNKDDKSNNNNNNKGSSSSSSSDSCLWCDVSEMEFFRENLKRDMQRTFDDQAPSWQRQEAKCFAEVLEFIDNDESFQCPGCDEGFVGEYREWLAQTYACIA